MQTTVWCLTLALSLSSFAVADTLTLKDGTKHSGTLVGATSKSITFREGTKVHRYSKSNIESIDFAPEAAAGTANSATQARLGSGVRQATLPAGTEITVMANEEIDSKTANEGQVFPADVAENVMNASGQVIIPKGAEAELVIRNIKSAGTVTGSSDLALDLQSVKVGGRRYTVSTEDVEQKGREGLGTNKRTAEMVGGGAVLGTLIGAIAGGGKGAAIGAATGAAAGAGTQVLTRGKAVKVPAETKLRFKLDQPLRLQAAY
jgi:hypothetical protein